MPYLVKKAKQRNLKYGNDGAVEHLHEVFLRNFHTMFRLFKDKLDDLSGTLFEENSDPLTKKSVNLQKSWVYSYLTKTHAITKYSSIIRKAL